MVHDSLCVCVRVCAPRDTDDGRHRQGVLLAILVKAHVIHCLDKNDPKWDAPMVATGIQVRLMGADRTDRAHTC